MSTSTKLQARIGQLTRERRESERAREAARSEVARLRAELATLQRSKLLTAPVPDTPPPADDETEPQESAFKNFPEYVKAFARWQVRKERAEIEADVEAQLELDDFTGVYR